MRLHPAFAAIFPALALCGCLEESVLSTVELTDAAAIRPEFEILRDRDGTSSSNTFEAVLRDRRGDPLEVLNGGVYVNGVQMRVASDFFGLPYYRIAGGLRYHYDSLYTFTIVLSDGAEYSSSVRTQKYDLGANRAKTRNGKAFITWRGDPVGPFIVDYTLSGGEYSVSRSVQHTPAKSPDSIWVSMEGQGRISHTMRTERRGTLNTIFKAGWITSTIRAKP